MKYLRLALVIAAFLGLAFVCWQLYLYTGRGTISVTATPTDATATIDGKAYNATTMKEITLKPGEHTLIVALDGFKPVTQVVSMGWQDSQNFTFKLQPKSFKAIYQNLSPDITNDNFDAVQEKFFLDNTWAAAYIVSGENEEDISVAVIKRMHGAWSLAYHNYRTAPAAANMMPAEVYDYIKEFTQ